MDLPLLGWKVLGVVSLLSFSIPSPLYPPPIIPLIQKKLRSDLKPGSCEASGEENTHFSPVSMFTSDSSVFQYPSSLNSHDKNPQWDKFQFPMLQKLSSFSLQASSYNGGWRLTCICISFKKANQNSNKARREMKAVTYNTLWWWKYAYGTRWEGWKPFKKAFPELMCAGPKKYEKLCSGDKPGAGIESRDVCQSKEDIKSIQCEAMNHRG